MSFQPSQIELPVRHLVVFAADRFRVAQGVNERDPVADASEVLLEDVYELSKDAEPRRLAIATEDETGAFRISPTSAVGRPGAPLHLDCLLTFMDATGETSEALVFVELDGEGAIGEVWMHPLAPFAPQRGYTLVRIDRERARARLASAAAVAFTRGTSITMADGRQVPIEALVPGDKVLTRDSGPQAVRWTGMQTLRATGAFAPITIAAGALNNTGDLVVGPNHRLFIYQRVDALGAGRKELLVRAELLVNGTTVTQEPGGFVDYFQILFDKHEIIYAEGIAAESLFVDTTTRPALPAEIARTLRADANRDAVTARELGRADLAARKDAAALLKRISAP